MNKLKDIRWVVLFSIVIASCNGGKVSKTPGIDEGTMNREVVTAYVTTAARSLEFVKREIAFSEKADSMSPFTIALVPDMKFQTMDGFGSAITGSTAYNLLKMSEEDRTAF